MRVVTVTIILTKESDIITVFTILTDVVRLDPAITTMTATLQTTTVTDLGSVITKPRCLLLS